MTEAIDHPPHYAAGREFEPIDVIEDWQLGFCLGNAVKYISRAGRKDPAATVDDLRKAAWYLAREIARLERATTDAVDSETPPPAQPLGRRKRARSAPPAPPQEPYIAPGPSASPTAEPAERAPAGDPTTDGLGPEAGTDPGPIPPETGLLRSAAA